MGLKPTPPPLPSTLSNLSRIDSASPTLQTPTSPSWIVSPSSVHKFSFLLLCHSPTSHSCGSSWYTRAGLPLPLPRLSPELAIPKPRTVLTICPHTPPPDTSSWKAGLYLLHFSIVSVSPGPSAQRKLSKHLLRDLFISVALMYYSVGDAENTK